MTATHRKVEDVPIGTRDLREFIAVHGEERVNETFERAARLRKSIGDRTVWNVNSTAVGGGVAEMLQSVLAFARGLEIDARRVDISGSPDFFQFICWTTPSCSASLSTDSPADAASGSSGDLVLPALGADDRILHDYRAVFRRR